MTGRDRGAVVFFTGLSGSGKTTIAQTLVADLARDARRQVTLLDGDVMRGLLWPELGFDIASREANIERLAWVAALLARHGGIAVAAPIAPLASGRAKARALVEPVSVFVLVYVSTPFAVAESRDVKGLYARARAGEIVDFTGISSPYEPPDDADVVIDTTHTPVEEAARRIRRILYARLPDDHRATDSTVG